MLDRLLTAGSDFGAALRLVNAALLSGGGEERLCTVDAAILDLFTCRLDLFKAGAAPTYILRQGRAAVVETPSLPAGILDGAQAEHTALTLAEGDLIVMVFGRHDRFRRRLDSRHSSFLWHSGRWNSSAKSC